MCLITTASLMPRMIPRQSRFREDVYKRQVYNKEKEMLAVYKMVDLAAKNDKLSDDTFAVAFEKKCVCLLYTSRCV